jgi:signal transduction histidine kinase
MRRTGSSPQTAALIADKRALPRTSREAIADTIQQLIDDLPEQIALLTENGDILAANLAWKQTVEEHGYPEVIPPFNFRNFCAGRAAQGFEPATKVLAGLDDICSQRRDFWQLTYNGGDNWHHRDYQISLHRVLLGGRSFISVTRFDLTEILELRRLNEHLTSSLLEERSIERQRMARELHDSTSQLLAAMGLILGRVRQQSPAPGISDMVEEMQDLLGQVHQEIRSLSHLAHSPSLEKLGLVAALTSLVEGFGRRSGIEASFEVEGLSTGMSRIVEAMMYRIAQEALSNVYRHARATEVRIQLSFRGSSTHFVVSDNGIGISAETIAGGGRAGVGLASMRSRVADAGGRLCVRNLSPGTAIIASVRC